MDGAKHQNDADCASAMSSIFPDDYTRYTPIKALTTLSNDWIIKARVTKKYDRRTWNNARGKGYLMNIDLIDAFGSQM